MPHRRTFLDITASATGQRWAERLDARQANVALAISQHYGISDIIARILAGRGVGIDEAPTFLNPTIKSLMPDPRTLTDMDKASARLAAAIALIMSFASMTGETKSLLLFSHTARTGGVTLADTPFSLLIRVYDPSTRHTSHRRRAAQPDCWQY